MRYLSEAYPLNMWRNEGTRRLTRRELPLKWNSASYRQGVVDPSECMAGRRWRDDCPN